MVRAVNAMQGKAKYAVAVLLIAVALGAFYACSPQRVLARRLKGADHVIFASNVAGYEDLKTTVSGKDVSKLVQAVANARRLSPNVDCTPESRLEFFRGSAHLATITNCVSVFWIGHTPYHDTSGTLEKLNQKRRDEYDERRMKPF
jgi:hypothetical protein